MNQVIWLLLAGVGGVAAILGWLMLLASLLLWMAPVSQINQRASSDLGSQPPRSQLSRFWKHLQLTGFSLLLALSGTAVLLLLARY